jgi:starvation-inducible outer membrane lipoprotein
MTKTILLLVAIALGLSGCAGMPTEYKSPCACDYRPLNTESEGLA